MLVRFWGVRGSIPSAINAETVENKIKKVLELASPNDILTKKSIEQFISTLPFSLRGTYGGNTTCIELRSRNDDLIIIDAGTGLRYLGAELMKDRKTNANADIHFLFTHSHWDHIQGFLFFIPLFIPNNKVIVHSCFDNIEERLRYQQVKTHFPLGFDEFPAEISFKTFKEGDIEDLFGLRITGKSVRHPGGNYSYKFEDEDKTFIFCSDAEFNLELMEKIDTYIEFFRDADVLVFDTQYTFEESLQKIDWGHSSASIATDIAIKANVKKLVLFHHDPSHNDSKMDEVTIQAFKYKNLIAPNNKLEIEAAYEGLRLPV